MREVFYEETALTQDSNSSLMKYNFYKILSYICYLFVVISVIGVLSFPVEENAVLLTIAFALIPVALFVFLGIFFGKLRDKSYVDYDYTFVTGSIRISKVINNLKRVQVFNFDCSNIEKLGYVDSDTYKRYLYMPNIEKYIATSNKSPSEDKKFCYIVAIFGGVKHLIILECSQLFISNLIRFTNRNALEQEFFNK